MARYAEIYHEAISDAALSDYFWALDHVSIEALEETIALVMREARKGFPWPAMLADFAVEWDQTERLRRARRRAETRGLAQENPLTPEEEATLKRQNEAERARLRDILARPNPERSGAPARLGDVLRGTHPHGKGVSRVQPT